MSKTTTPPHGRQKYPWHVWENGRAHRARRGFDFTCKPQAFANGLFVRAGRSSKTVETRVMGDVVWFRFSK